MADTRKHRVTIRDELDAQLMAQMGEEPVRPYEAGEFHNVPPQPAKPTPAAPVTPSLGAVPASALASFATLTKP